MDLLPKVFRTEGDVTEFDPSKILVSLIKEAGMSEKVAKEITELTVRRIISSGIKFLSGPHIREIVCSILSEQHLEDERKLYTRIGMPLMDYEDILDKGPKGIQVKTISPEKIQHWAANRISSEYALLKILSTEESRAHLFGDIHIHKLEYFDLRPFSQWWDPRLILKHGIPPFTNLSDSCKSGPAETFGDAIIHLTKWLGITQAEFSGAQGLRYITTFLSPYAKRMEDNIFKKQILNFFYELNQLDLIIGRKIPEISVSSSPPITEDLRNVPAIGPKGEICGVYGDYNEESLKIFNIITEVFRKGDFNGNPFENPEQIIYFNDKWLKEYEEAYLNVCRGINHYRSPIFVNMSSKWLINKNKYNYSELNYVNYGIMQIISLNLPRYAYMSRNEEMFMEVLIKSMETCFAILKKKYDILKRVLNANHLPMCSAIIDGERLLNLANQEFSIGFVGLNETVKHLTDFELHESPASLALGEKILSRMDNICKVYSKRDNLRYSLLETTSNLINYRFEKLNYKHFPKSISPQLEGNHYSYTFSAHFRRSADISLFERVKKRENFHSILQNGVIEQFELKQVTKEHPDLIGFLKQICQDTNIVCFQFIP